MNPNAYAAFRTIALPVLALCLTACTYGPTRELITIDTVLRRPNTREFASVVRHVRLRDATGLAAFPDGGAAKVDSQWIDVYFANVDERSVTRVGTMQAMNEVWVSFESLLGGWRGDTAVGVVTGCPRGGQCYGVQTRRFYFSAIPTGGIVRRDSAGQLVVPSGMGASEPGERSYMRATTMRDTIKVRTVDGAPYVPMFAVDRSGILRPIP